MTKNDIAVELQKRIDIPKSTAISTVEALTDIIADAFCNGDSIFIRGFGTLEVKLMSPKKSHNFITGESIIAPAYRTVKFKISKQLKTRMNNGTVD